MRRSFDDIQLKALHDAMFISFEETRIFAKFARPSNIDKGFSAVCVVLLRYGILCSEMG